MKSHTDRPVRPLRDGAQGAAPSIPDAVAFQSIPRHDIASVSRPYPPLNAQREKRREQTVISHLKSRLSHPCHPPREALPLRLPNTNPRHRFRRRADITMAPPMQRAEPRIQLAATPRRAGPLRPLTNATAVLRDAAVAATEPTCTAAGASAIAVVEVLSGGAARRAAAASSGSVVLRCRGGGAGIVLGRGGGDDLGSGLGGGW